MLAEDWEILRDCGAFTDYIGPIYRLKSAPSDEEPSRIGFRVLPHHCNPSGACHGGMLASVVDVALGLGGTTIRNDSRKTPTINMGIDYVGPASVGDWIESRVTMVQQSRRLCFMQGILLGPKGTVLRANATYRIPSS